MDKKVLRERIRKKQQQMRRRKMMRLGAYVIAVILVVIFVIRGILIPVVNRIGGKSVDKPAQVQAETDQTNVDSDTVSDGTDSTADTTTTSAVNSAARYPLKNDLAKASQMSIGWNENENGKWVKVSDNIYLDTSSISKTKYLISGWFKIYDTPENDLYTVNGVDVYYTIDKYEVSCAKGDDAIFVDHFKYFDINNNILLDEEDSNGIGCSCRGLVNGELICKELCKRF